MGFNVGIYGGNEGDGDPIYVGSAGDGASIYVGSAGFNGGIYWSRTIHGSTRAPYTMPAVNSASQLIAAPSSTAPLAVTVMLCSGTRTPVLASTKLKACTNVLL